MLVRGERTLFRETMLQDGAQSKLTQIFGHFNRRDLLQVPVVCSGPTRARDTYRTCAHQDCFGEVTVQSLKFKI
jgi:hypothetical protein